MLYFLKIRCKIKNFTPVFLNTGKKIEIFEGGSNHDYTTQPSAIITCGTSFCVENKKKKQGQPLTVQVEQNGSTTFLKNYIKIYKKSQIVVAFFCMVY